MTDVLDCDVAVIGLGPVGATMANLLAEAGLRVIAFDREPGVLQSPRAVGMDGEIMRIVQTLGLADDLLPYLKVFRGTQYLDADGAVVATRPGVDSDGPQAWANRYNIHQPDFEEVMRKGFEQRPSITVKLRHEVTALTQDDTAATVTATDLETGQETSIRARYVVGCDGGRSITRRAAGAVFDDYGLNEPWIVVDFAINETADLPPINTHFADPVEPVIYVNVVRNLRRFEFKARPDEDLEAALDPELIWQRVSPWLEPSQAELVRAAVYTHRSLVAQRWRNGRLLLAGDAAHQTPPFLGQGLCAGLRDASSLAWRLGAVCNQGASEELLDDYGAERGEHSRFYIRTATSLGPVLTAPDAEQLKALNARVGREGSGQPPRLGPGLFRDDAVGGRLAPQPRLADGRRLDDLVGYRFGVVASAEAVAALDEQLISEAEAAQFVVVTATGPAQSWLEDLGAVAVILRPDRYYYGAFADADDLVVHLKRLIATMHPTVAA